MSGKRKIEIFSAGCPVCQETVEMVKRISCFILFILSKKKEFPIISTKSLRS